MSCRGAKVPLWELWAPCSKGHMTILGLYRSFQPKHSDPSGRMDSVLHVLGPSVFLCVHNHMYHSAIIAFTCNCSYSYLATWHLADWSKLHMPWGALVSSHCTTVNFVFQVDPEAECEGTVQPPKRVSSTPYPENIHDWETGHWSDVLELKLRTMPHWWLTKVT